MDGLLAGRYRLHGLIGRGGMAEVYAATDERLGREIAIKVLAADDLTPQDRRRFIREARAIAGFSHPNVVTLFDADEADGHLYLAMERIVGTTLAASIDAGPLDAATATDVARQLLSALDAAHRSGVIHRDVKPSNVLLDAEGHAKLVDFGIAIGVDEPAGDLTGTGQHIGTPKYMAPEVVSGGSPTVASDVYAVGVVLYEMLTGRPPFDAATPIARALAHVNEPVPDVLAARPGTPRHLAAAVSTAMAKDPSARYPSAEAMRRAIDQESRQLPRPVEPTEVMAGPSGVRRSWGRRLMLIAAAAAVTVGVVAAVVVVQSDDDRDSSASSSPVGSPPAAASSTLAPTTAATAATTASASTTTGPGTSGPTTLESTDAVETPADLIALLSAGGGYGARTPDVIAALDKLGNGRKATDRAVELLENATNWVAAGELDPAVLDLLHTVLAPIADGPGNGNGNGNR